MKALSRLGVIGDVHCEDGRLEEAIRTLRAEGAEALVQVGDITDGHGSLERCVELLQKHDVVTIAGNHERWFLKGEMRSLEGATLEATPDARAFLAALPPTRRLVSDGGGILACHGIGEDDMVNLRADTRGYALQPVMDSLRPLMLDDELAYVVCGHTHERMVRKFDGITIINAGTLHDSGPAGFVMADFGAGCVRCWDFEGTTPTPAATLPLA